MIDDGPTSVNVNYRDTHESPTGLSYGLAMFIFCTGGRPCCLVLFVKEIKTCRHTHRYTGFQGLDMFDSSKHVATTSALTWCIVVKLIFHTTSLLPQLPKNDSVFLDISGRLFLKIHEDGFSVPLQLAFLPFLMKFLMKGLVRWVPFFSVWSFSLWMHADSYREVHMTMVLGIRVVTAVKISMVPIC